MTRKDYYTLFFCLLSSIVPVLAIDVPRGLAFAPGVIGLIFAGLYFFVHGSRPALSFRTLWLCVIIFSISAASLIWAMHFDVSLKQVKKLALLLPPQIILISLVYNLRKEQLSPHIHVFSYGFIFAALLLCFEILSGGLLFNLIRGEDLNIAADPDEFNRGAVVLSLYSFSAIAILRTRLGHYLYSLLILVPLVIGIFISESQSSQLSLIAGSVFLFLFPYRSKFAWVGLKFFILALMFGAPFFISHIYQNYAADIQNIPGMARAYAGHRLEIWDYVSRYAMGQPWYGFGIEMTRATIFDSPNLFDKSNSVLHPHNFALQIWIEFGVVGILIAMGLMYSLLTAIQKQFTRAQQRIILPTFMAAMIPAAFAFGMWQGWWIATLFHLASICLLACKVTDDVEKEESGRGDVAN